MKQRYRRHRCYTREGAQRRRVRIFGELKKVAIAALAVEIERDLWALCTRDLSANWSNEYRKEAPGWLRVAKPRQLTGWVA